MFPKMRTVLQNKVSEIQACQHARTSREESMYTRRPSAGVLQEV